MATSDNFVDFVDFGDSDDETAITPAQKSLYNMGSNKYEYDGTTLKHYKAIRMSKFNVFLPESTDFDVSTAFAYPHMWDPYNGKITGIDPYGPLLFFPDDLVYYFYSKRLDMIWNEPIDDIGAGYFAGYYGDAVGAGINITVSGRGDYPEKYLFRLPITNCYLPTTHHLSTVTMGPILTDDQVRQIDELAAKNKTHYKKNFGKDRPSLVYIKQLYDQAISKTPDISKLIKATDAAKLSKSALQDYYNRANRIAVDALVKI
jgi:hypothetical protein